VPDIIKALDARPGSIVADVGRGQGDFTLPIARAVRPSGRVIGEDISILAALKPGGRFVLIEPFHQSSAGLSREAQTAKHNLAADLGEQELRAAGFTTAERDNDFVKFTAAPGGFWMIVARKPTTRGLTGAS